MESNGVGWRAVVLVGLVSAAVGAGAAIAWGRSDADGLRQELASLSRRIGRIETPSKDQPPIKLLRAQRIEIVAPNGTKRGVIEGDEHGASLQLWMGDATVSLSALDRHASISVDGGASEIQAIAIGRVASLEVTAHGQEPRSSGVARLQAMGLGNGSASLSLEQARPWKREEIEAEIKSPTHGAAISLDVLHDAGCEVAITDANGRSRLSASVAGTGAPRLDLLDAEGRARLSLGRVGLKGTLGDLETPEDSIVSFGEDGLVKWREPR